MTPLKRNPESVKLAAQIMEVYKPTTIADMHNALKDLFAPAIESMLKGELKNHLGYNAEYVGNVLHPEPRKLYSCVAEILHLRRTDLTLTI